jgi:DNA-binding NarL/FixJ family response regulator
MSIPLVPVKEGGFEETGAPAPSLAAALHVCVLGPPLLAVAILGMLQSFPTVVSARICGDLAEVAQRSAAVLRGQHAGATDGAATVLVLTARSAPELAALVTGSAYPAGDDAPPWSGLWITDAAAAAADRAGQMALRHLGVRAVVTWDDRPAVLHYALLEAAAGRSFRSPRLAPPDLEGARFATSMPHIPRFTPTAEAEGEEHASAQRTLPPSLPAARLSARQEEVAALAAVGLSNEQIAAQLSIELNTVKVHMQRIFAALGIRRRSQIVAALASDTKGAATTTAR